MSLKSSIFSIENAIALKQKRDSAWQNGNAPDLSSSSSSSSYVTWGKRKSSPNIRTAQSDCAKRSRPVRRGPAPKQNRSIQKNRGCGDGGHPIIESSFENRWELVQVGHRFITIPKQQQQERLSPSVAAFTDMTRIKTYSKGIVRARPQVSDCSVVEMMIAHRSAPSPPVPSSPRVAAIDQPTHATVIGNLFAMPHIVLDRTSFI